LYRKQNELKKVEKEFEEDSNRLKEVHGRVIFTLKSIKFLALSFDKKKK